VSDATVRKPVLLRGAATGLVTAALSLAAHAFGGGHLAVGPAMVGLLLVGVTVGAAAVAMPRTAGVAAMGVLLTAGQLAGHAVLAVGHPHTAASPSWAMVIAHLGAVTLGALLITTGERLCRMLVRVVRRVSAPAGATEFASPPRILTPGDQPLYAELLLTTSMSHRGPPVVG
jgi:hypothetical protein